MNRYRRILLIMTEVQANAALYRAMALATTSGASLHVLGIHEPNELQLRHALQESPLPSAAFVHFSTGLQALLDEQPALGLQLSFEAVESLSPRDLLPACIARYAPDLVIKACPGCSLLDQIARNSLDQVLLHASAAPLLFVPANAPAVPGNVLVAVDVANPSPENDALNHALLAAGQQLVAQCRGSCTCSLLTTCRSPCWPIPTSPAPGPTRCATPASSPSTRWPMPMASCTLIGISAKARRCA